jgi:hypothetical protein
MWVVDPTRWFALTVLALVAALLALAVTEDPPSVPKSPPARTTGAKHTR